MREEKPPLPVIHTIPRSLVEQWTKVSPDDDVEIRLTKADVDNLFFAINGAISSVASIQEALIAYSNGSVDEANGHMDSSKRSNFEALNYVRSLMSSLMASAIQNRNEKT
jgi:hypothetical protein